VVDVHSIVDSTEVDQWEVVVVVVLATPLKVITDPQLVACSGDEVVDVVGDVDAAGEVTSARTRMATTGTKTLTSRTILVPRIR